MSEWRWSSFPPLVWTILNEHLDSRLETLLQLGSLEMSWSSESDVEGEKYIFAWLFTSEVTKQESGGQNLVGCLASFLGSLRLRIIAFQHLS